MGEEREVEEKKKKKRRGGQGNLLQGEQVITGEGQRRAGGFINTAEKR